MVRVRVGSWRKGKGSSGEENKSIPAESWMEHLEGGFHMWRREILKAGDNSELFVEGEENVLQEGDITSLVNNYERDGKTYHGTSV